MNCHGDIRNMHIGTKEFTEQIESLVLLRKDMSINERMLKYHKGEYPFLRISSKDIGKDDKIFLICAGVHGDEISGPLTILENFNDIVDNAHERGLKLIIYPLRNPSGFDKGLRHNIDDDRGYFNGNNVLMFYKLKDRTITGDIMGSDDFLEWKWLIDSDFDMPLETRVMSEFLREDPISQIKAVLDIHQDHFTYKPSRKSSEKSSKKSSKFLLNEGTYHYSFDDLYEYGKTVEKIRIMTSVLGNRRINAGYDKKKFMKTDSNGFIIRNDGSISDLLHRHRPSVKYNIACETIGKMDINRACAVNLIWIYDLIYLASK